MTKPTLVSLLGIIVLYSCKKSADPVYPDFHAYVGVSTFSYPYTTIQYLDAIGHLHEPEITMAPKHAFYSEIKKDSLGHVLYYYTPEPGFHGEDSIKFRSVEPSLKETVISTYVFTIQ